MTSFADASLHHSVCFYNVILDINRAYLQGGQYLSNAFFLLDTNWDKILKSRAWAVANMDSNRLAAQVSRQIAVMEILNLRQEFDQRIQWLNSAFKSAGLLKDQQGEADVLSKLGVVYAKKGNLDSALHNYEKALSIYVKLSDRLGESN